MIEEINANADFWFKVYTLMTLSIILLQFLTQQMLGAYLNRPLKAFLGVLLILELVIVVCHLMTSIAFVISLNGVLILTVFIQFYLIGKTLKDAK
jgi:hypothetical protein